MSLNKLLIEEPEQMNPQPLQKINMHPMTQLRSPNLLDQNKNSLFEITCEILYAALPLILCFELNAISYLINIYLIGNFDTPKSMAAIGLGTVLANIFGFLVIENMSVGFSVIAMGREDKEEVGFMYQKTMGINFFVCILVTPILYLSDRFLKLIGFNEELVDISSNYLWALVPSFYLYAFYETTKNYLQSQGVIYPCLVIGTCCSVLHYIIAKFMIDDLGLGIMGAAWSKNISFLCSSLILYLYIIKQEPAKESWIQWNIKATNDVHHFLGKIITHEIFTYYEVLAFQILGLVACYLWDPKHIAAHLAFSATLIILYFMHMGISHCVNKTLSISIAENDVRMGKKKIKLGICMSVILSIIIVANLWFNQDVLFIFFNQNHESVAFMKVVFNVFLLVALFDGLQITLLGVLKTLRIRQVYAFCLFGFYVIGVGGGILLAYKFQVGLLGIWGGWALGLAATILAEFMLLNKLNWEECFDLIQDRYPLPIKQPDTRTTKQIIQQN